MRILICNNALRNFAGSEIHCSELAAHFVADGHSVTAASFSIGEPIAGEFKRIGVEVVPLDTASIDLDWDLIWTHHVTCFAEVHARRRLRARCHVHGLLSSFIPIERVPFPKRTMLDRTRFSLLANAPLTARAAKPSLPGGIPIKVLWNLAPPPWQLMESRRRQRLERIAVVSSHPPQEVRDLQAIAARAGVEMHFFRGMAAGAFRITPEILAPFDAVITIGKTVQYCLAAGIPVFVYDHFQGPGWLTWRNIGKAERANYSGKCTRVIRPAEALWDELTGGFTKAVGFHLWRRRWAARRYDIRRQLDRLRIFKLAREPSPLLQDHDGSAADSVIAYAEETKTLPTVFFP